MKKLALAAVLAGAATGAMAKGHTGKDDVMMEPVVVMEEAQATSSSAGLVIPLVLLAIVAAAVSAD